MKKFTNYWYGEWLLVNKKIILIVGLNENLQEVCHINILLKYCKIVYGYNITLHFKMSKVDQIFKNSKAANFKRS